MSGNESQSSFATASANDAARPLPGDQVHSPFRQFVESLLCLVLAVIVFRAFAVEGYMISTGSMAPSLLGFHKQVVCPTCKYPFAFGVSYQPESSRTISGDGEEEESSDPTGPQLCTCPNCGQRAIEISDVPRNQGDQLLVFREAYWHRMPRRWETIVFRNPYDTAQAYVKRLAGLPGETIAVRSGDVYADGTLCRKNYATQNAVRIPVYDHDYEPTDDPQWRSRWQPDPGWERDGHGFVMRDSTPPPTSDPPPSDSTLHGLKFSTEDNPWSWVVYGHYVRSGGRHVTSVKIPVIEEKLNWPPDLFPAKFDLKTRQLSIQGVMPAELWERLRKLSHDSEYREAIDRLDEHSHYSPVMDDYGYNRVTSQSSQNAVRDLMISFDLAVTGPSAKPASERLFAVDMGDGENAFRLLFDCARKEIRLLANPEQAPYDPPLRTVPLRSEWLAEPCRVEMSLFDRQITVAVNGEELFPAWEIPTPLSGGEAPRFPVRLGARGLAVRVDSLQLFRDVYYTSPDDEKPFTLGEDELYVLGDNSPVSLDSRRWKNGAVPVRLLLGKPFVVHLPSRQLKIRIGDTVRHIRIPDFPKVRYIH